MATNQEQVWVFHGEDAKLASAVFRSKAAAAEWIAEHRLSGLLTAYPLDVSVFDWAVADGRFKPKEGQHNPRFIQSFTSAYLEHAHFHDGVES